MAPLPNFPTDPDDDPAAYVGLAAETAARQARERGWTDVRALAPGAVITLEYRVGRLNFEVDEGVVRRSWKG
ncbi:proteinase inhibitor I78 [Streptomyces cinnamoneus]|uniref:Proteinase inhibitor I78 n=1 Tax=Streptomyces cinnamoneus TaxID=53446 RepID=A0A2G1XB45_STRCJ|nr:I78 family peptidase inhibitor [Streptomyces cinnamoneus]PHQ48435.1 proteinase inhibitor I78 [Streptomyces cinnamoneus]PPT12569.1 proteinase inhibitor I78 [Streptomyces cinnamoneus]